MVKGTTRGSLVWNRLQFTLSNVNMIEPSSMNIKIVGEPIVITNDNPARDYYEAVVGSVQDSDLEVFDYMLRYRQEICDMLPETYQLLQSDNAFDDVELHDPLVVIRGNDIILWVYGGNVIDSDNMWILQVPDDSSPHYYLRHHLCTKRHETAVMGLITRLIRGVQKHEVEDGVDLPLTTILEMFPETVEPIGEDQKQLYHELALNIQTLARQRTQPIDDLIRQSATMFKQQTKFYQHQQLLI
jgi:hypothetical protein